MIGWSLITGLTLAALLPDASYLSHVVSVVLASIAGFVLAHVRS